MPNRILGTVVPLVVPMADGVDLGDRLASWRAAHSSYVPWMIPTVERWEGRLAMKRVVGAFVGAVTVTLMLAPPAEASVKWIFNVPGEGDVVFVTAADAALHGSIRQT
jgi:hypothetical protein